MRAEDLFEAVGEIDEKLIARSDRRVRSSQEKSASGAAPGRKRRPGRRKSRRSVGAEIYRFAVVAMSTAAVVFVLLMAKDILGIRSLSDVRNRLDTTREISTAEGMQAEEALAGQADESAAEPAEEPAAEQADEPAAELAKEPSAEQAAADEAEVSPEIRAAGDENSEEAIEGPADREAGDEAGAVAGRGSGVKTAVDLLGDLKGDYVSLEYISAEDEANGGSRKVPEYSEKGEEAFSEAFSKGKPAPAMLVSTGEPTYYVYLTKENGEVHRVIFYEKAYVSMDNIPGVVMKISQADYEEVKVLFR